MIKALFFDIDGTLVSFDTHAIPVSTTQALTQAKQNGLQIFISTGRPLSLITNLNDIQHLIDGYITTNGAYCFIGKQLISSAPIPKDDAQTLIRLSDKMHFATLVVGTTRVAIHNSNTTIEHIFKTLLNAPQINDTTPIDALLEEPILQFTPIITQEQEGLIAPQLKGSSFSRWNPEFADLNALHANKGNGLLAIAKQMQFKPEETMAFGDGGNDITILQTAGIGVAMGNAHDSVKQEANYVTESVDHNGIANALKHWHII